MQQRDAGEQRVEQRMPFDASFAARNLFGGRDVGTQGDGTEYLQPGRHEGFVFAEVRRKAFAFGLCVGRAGTSQVDARDLAEQARSG
jgi:hypothetical protein